MSGEKGHDCYPELPLRSEKEVPLLPVRVAAARRLKPIGIARAAGCAEAPHKNEGAGRTGCPLTPA